jgi:futalosine hydrolase
MRLGVDIALLAAVPLEIEGLTPGLSSITDHMVGGERFALGTIRGQTVLVGTLGVGKTNAAATVGALAERFELRQVWHLGCAGAYSEGPLAIGDVLISTQCRCGDEGILEDGSERPRSALGIPSVTVGDRQYFDDLPVDGSLLNWARSILPSESLGRTGNCPPGDSDPGCLPHPITVPERGEEGGPFHPEGFRVHYGPSLTVSLVSGDALTARKRFERHQALAENMEGSAVVQTCLRFGIPVLEIRGISNLAGDRDKSHWRLDMSMGHCHAVVRRLLNAWVDSPGGSPENPATNETASSP